MARTDKMKLGTFVYTFGFHPASWLHPASNVHGANDFSHLLDVAKRSEAAKFDFMFMADLTGRRRWRSGRARPYPDEDESLRAACRCCQPCR